jgi:hypothetical protein
VPQLPPFTRRKQHALHESQVCGAVCRIDRRFLASDRPRTVRRGGVLPAKTCTYAQSTRCGRAEQYPRADARAAEMAAKAHADGHTLFIASDGNLAINVSLFSKLPCDPARDFAPIALPSTTPSIVAVHPSEATNSATELIALAKANPASQARQAARGCQHVMASST